MALEIVQIKAGQMENFSYLIFCPQTRRAAAVDPSLEPENLLEAARRRDLTIELLINTHGHRDHAAGNDMVLRETDAQLAGHSQDVPRAQIPLEDGSTLELGEGTIEVIHTPGHTPGSICLHAGGGLVTGDTLFITFVGRADMPGSDPEALYRSLQRLAGYPAETKVYPGHDYGPRPVSTIGFEKENNPYLKCADLQEFLNLRMG